MARVFEILIVDDSPTQLLLMKGILDRHDDLHVRTARNGREALETVQQNSIDLVLSDLQMPEMDGLELVQAVKLSAPRVPVILTTSQGSEEIAAKALQQGAASYVPKRQMSTELLSTIRQVLDLAESDRKREDVSKCVVASSLRLCFANDETLVPGIISRLEQALVELDLFDEGERMQISMALDEAILNAMIHGNLEVSSELREVDDGEPYRELINQRASQTPYQERRVKVDLEATKQSVEFVIADEGHGFDVSSLPDPTDPANLENVSGRGLLLIRAFMDTVEHNDKGNRLTLRKQINGQPADD